MKHRIMILEDDKSMRIQLEGFLKENGYSAYAYKKGIDGVNALNKDEISLVITDVSLSDMQGIDVLKMIKKEDANVPVIMISSNGTIKGAVDAMKHGAFDYISRPFTFDEFILIVKRALDVRELREENIRLKRDLSECFCYANMIGESTEMKNIYDFIGKVSQTDSTVLISGESGTGKELVASTIHYQSKRNSGPLIKVNCAAFPEHLVESELFGYEQGAFTGAAKRKPGRFERADKGTIFLDEIGDLPSCVQIKLLRVLQDGAFERLGGTEELSVDARVIAATNRDLEEDVKNGRFREDLYYRLNVIPVNVAPLRKRKDDIPLLIDHFLDCYNCRYGKRISLSSEAIMVLMDYNFPGNIRELENIVERCVTLSTDDIIQVKDLPSHILKNRKNQSAMGNLSDVMTEVEKAHIVRILKAAKGNKTRAAGILGISRKTLWEKTNTYNIDS
ncbi:MAG: sigma-54 dependent transcriptional regulator [Nitrospirota bacterium]